MKEVRKIRVHRFHDTLAIAIEGVGETIYLGADISRALAGVLMDGVASIQGQPKYSASDFPTMLVRGMGACGEYAPGVDAWVARADESDKNNRE